MLYLVAIFIPPLAILLAGKPFQAVICGMIWILSLVFALLGGVFGLFVLAVWAILVVRDRNTKKMFEEVASRTQN